MSPTWPKEMLASTTFEDAGAGKTLMTISWAPHNSDAVGEKTFDEARAGMAQGFAGTFAKLKDYIARLKG